MNDKRLIALLQRRREALMQRCRSQLAHYQPSLCQTCCGSGLWIVMRHHIKLSCISQCRDEADETVAEDGNLKVKFQISEQDVTSAETLHLGGVPFKKKRRCN